MLIISVKSPDFTNVLRCIAVQKKKSM